MVNDGYISLTLNEIFGMLCDVLTRSYSSVNCLVYLTVNRYVDIPGSDLAHLLWLTAYSHDAPDTLAEFINDLGRKWFDHLDTLIGPFDDKIETSDSSIIKGSISL